MAHLKKSMGMVLTCYSDDSSSNAAEDYNFSVKCCLKITKINKRGPFQKQTLSALRNYVTSRRALRPLQHESQ